jgi:hypothetical protein
MPQCKPQDAFYSAYDSHLLAACPDISSLTTPWESCNVVSPYKIVLPQGVIDRVEQAVANIFGLSRADAYRKALLETGADRQIILSPAKNLSVLMSYDFHLDREGKPRLLEINTNAAGFLLADAIYQVHSEPGPFPGAANALKNSFFEEFDRTGLGNSPHIAIIDEAPWGHKMFPEFLLYKSLFESWGCTCTIHDYKDLVRRKGALWGGAEGQKKRIDFIYNRYCDFTLADPTSKKLREAYLNGGCTFSPNPREYFLLADKRRLVQFSRPGWLETVAPSDVSIEAVRKVLVPTWDKTGFEDINEIWEKRKQLFFKPPQSYAGKSAYRGANITRKVFNRVLGQDTLIQQYVPAPVIQFENDESETHWKYDLRAYAYGGEVQLLVARIYQGQITNFNQVYGGYCPVFVL